MYRWYPAALSPFSSISETEKVFQSLSVQTFPGVVTLVFWMEATEEVL